MKFFERMLAAAFGNVLREYRFHPQRKWRIDFYLPSVEVGIEIEGGVWKMGRHNRPSGYIRDVEKYNTAALMGIKIYRIPGHDVKHPGKVVWHIQNIARHIKREASGGAE